MCRVRMGMVAGMVAGLLLAGTAGRSEPPCPTPPPAKPSLVYQRLHLPPFPELAMEEKVPDPAPDLVGGRERLPAEKIAGIGIADLALQLETGSALTPYLGAGVDIPSVEDEAAAVPEVAAIGKESLPSAYLLSAGIGCAVGDNAQMDLGYRYTTGNLPVPIDAPGTSRLRNDEDHNISINLKFVY